MTSRSDNPAMVDEPLRAYRRQFLLCFSAKDAEGKAAVMAHLAPMRNTITLWSVDDVPAGGQIPDEFLRVAADAQVALLLLSADFFAALHASPLAEQIAHLRQQQASRGLQLIPILWRDCDWRAVSWLAPLTLLPADGVAIRARDIAQQDRALAELAQNLDGRSSTSYRPGPTRVNAQLTVLIPAVGVLMLPLASIGAGLSAKTYHSLFLTIGALGGLYLLFGLFFANISMFSERQRYRIVALLIAALVTVTLLLGARAARQYFRARGELGKKVATPATYASVPLQTVDALPETADLQQPEFDLLPSVVQPGMATNRRKSSVELDVSDLAVASPVIDLSANPPNPPDDASTHVVQAPKSIPEMLIRADILNAETPHLSDKVKAKFICQELEGTYRIEVDVTGAVAAVTIVAGISDADEDIISVVKQWRFKPQKQPVRFVKQFTFFIDDGQGCGPKIVTGEFMKKNKISKDDDPHISDYVKSRLRDSVLKCSYKVCVEKNGKVSDVTTIKSIDEALSLTINREDDRVMDRLKTWRFKPQPEKVCFVQYLEYHVE